MKKLFLFLWLIVFAVTLLALPVMAQTNDVLETSWKVSVTGAYSNVSNQQTNNGFLTSIGIRVATHWNARLDYFTIADPSAAVIVAGPEYNFSLAHVLPQSSFMDVSKLEAFVNFRAGAGRPQGGVFKPAIATGGGINYRVSVNLVLRPIEVSYVRSAAGAQWIGNHAQFASGIGLKF